MSVVDKDLGYSDILEGLFDLEEDDPSVLLGVRAVQGQDLVIYAGSNEFGVPDRNLPERSFLRSTVNENLDQYTRALTRASERLTDPKAGSPGKRRETLQRDLERLGAVAVADVQRKIRDLKEPPNAPSTIERKGADNPLVDTGRLRQSIEAEVVNE